MIISNNYFNENQGKLQKIISKKEEFSQVISLILLQHNLVHSSNVSNLSYETFEDQVWNNFNDKQFRYFSPKKSIYSVAWHLWHSARIEDICVHFFISHTEQIFVSDDFQKKMNVEYINTGNSFGLEEMEKFNNFINLEELRNYRTKVGVETQKIIKNLDYELLMSKVDKNELVKIGNEGYVDEKSDWLLEFWGKKRIKGIVTMPLTRHLLVHLNDSKRILKIK